MERLIIEDIDKIVKMPACLEGVVIAEEKQGEK
jgi:hypothetical protein